MVISTLLSDVTGVLVRPALVTPALDLSLLLTLLGLGGLVALAVPGLAAAFGLLPALADLLLPRSCASCRAPGGALCARCAVPLGSPGIAVPLFTGTQAAAAGRERADPSVWALGAHEGVLRRLVIAHKERGRAALTSPLAAALARLAVRALEARGEGEVWVVGVPSGRRSVRRRGRDAIRELAEAVAVELRARGRPARAVRALSRRPGTADQGGLGPVARRRNLRGAMRASPKVAGARVLLVDDVATTGASLREAHRALTEAGANVQAAVLLTTVLKGRITTKSNARLGKSQESGKLTGASQPPTCTLTPASGRYRRQVDHRP
ncbi:ComF family protein [Actinocorallia sp. A-T 12471]|uniref:ComF family protein n=1 Tax=Actinocorallia sp. A-T 12471 TaxID=3089813 RepID=UPI0029CCD97E|nr:phosphoribosyltransferase family protein [Actinocorallia sp. A-T 12471]MDX6744583.1 phosphoribosyltransferase family protein [Actinocorallia sp. A-T 12471]